MTTAMQPEKKNWQGLVPVFSSLKVFYALSILGVLIFVSVQVQHLLSVQHEHQQISEKEKTATAPVDPTVMKLVEILALQMQEKHDLQKQNLLLEERIHTLSESLEALEALKAESKLDNRLSKKIKKSFF